MLNLINLKRALVALLVIAPLSFSAFAAEDEDGQRKPPEARTSGTLDLRSCGLSAKFKR